MTLAELIERYMTAKAAQGRYNAKSVHAVTHRLGGLAQSFGPDRPAVELDRDAIETWLGTLTGLKATTRSSYLSSIKTFTRWAAGRDLLPTDPCSAVEGIRRPRSVPRALTRAQVAAILGVCRYARERSAVMLMVGCGLRSGEVASLDWSDVSLDERMMIVTGKNDDEREVPIPAEVAAVLEELPHRRGAVISATKMTNAKRGHLAAGKRDTGMPLLPATVAGMVGRLVREAGLKRGQYDGRSAHALRHTCASDVLDNCDDLRVVQQLLGHQNLATTAIYLRRADIGKIREAMEGRAYT